MSSSTDQVNRVRHVFDQWARNGRAEGMERGHGPAARVGFDWLGLSPGDRYLDVGCGNGYTVRWAAAVHPSVEAIGLDVAPEMIERARALSADYVNARFTCGQFPTPDLDPGSFQAAFSMEVLYYLPDLSAALGSIRDVLAPGGRFACIVDFFEEHAASASWPDDLGVEMTRLSAAGWRDACERAGFTVSDQHATDTTLTTLCQT